MSQDCQASVLRSQEFKHNLSIMDEGEDFCVENIGSAEDNRFDEIVGALEDAIMDPSFNDLQNEFFAAYANEFENSEENKLSYTPIFDKYVNTMEKAICDRLQAQVEGFDMEEFMKMLENRQDQITGDIFDMLTSLADFPTFKGMMLAYKEEMSNESPNGLDQFISVQSLPVASRP